MKLSKKKPKTPSMFAFNQDPETLASGPADLPQIGDAFDDIVAHLIALAGISKERAQAIEVEIRGYWGGERPYIAKAGEAGRRLLSERHARIRAESARGESDRLLGRRWGLTPRRIRQIVSAK